MPRDTIRRLGSDVERILVAGAHLASADPALTRDKTALDALATQLGAKAPVIGQLAAAVGRTLAASGADTARELVGLATMTAQVRAAQAQPAPAGPLTPLIPRPEIGTPCNAKELGELYTALVETGKGRIERVQQAIERGDIVDLRLVEPLIHAMNDGYLGDLVADQAIPRLGPAIVAPIRGIIEFKKGRRIDGRRLRAVVAADPANAHGLLAQALAEGSAEVRESALDAIADHVPGDPRFEQPVQALVAKERHGGVFRAALRALAGYASDASLAALTTALDDARTVEAAAEGLGNSRHPGALGWMLDRLAVAVVAAEAENSSTSNTKNTPVPANSVKPVDLVPILLSALARHRDPRIAGAALPLIDRFGDAAAQAVLGSGDPRQVAAVADLLAGDDRKLFAVAAQAAVRLPADQAFKRLSAAVTASDRDTKTGLARLEAATDQVVAAETVDPRWGPLALKQFDAPPEVLRQVLPVLGRLRERKAVKPLLKLLPAAPDLVQVAACGALGAIGGAGVLPGLLPLLGHRDWSVRMAAQHAIVALDDPTSVDPVRTLLVQADGKEDWTLRHLLRTLERRHPGK